MRTIVLALALVAAAPAIAAEDRPPPMPTRDVLLHAQLDITDISGPRPPAAITLRVSAATHRMRVDVAGRAGFMVLDPTVGRTLIVATKQRAWMEQPYRPLAHAMFILPNLFAYSPLAAGSVGGRACQMWDMQSPTIAGHACVTPDGVVLQLDSADNDGDGDDMTLKLVVQDVTYAHQKASDFAAPAGFRKLAPPGQP